MLKNEWFKKLLLFPLLIALSVLLTSAYGALQNVPIYAFAPHYFEYSITRLTFPGLTPLASAAADGWISFFNSSLPASIVLCICGVFAPTAKQLVRLLLQAVGVLIIVSLAVEVALFLTFDFWFAGLGIDSNPKAESNPEESGAVSYWKLRIAQNMGVLAGTICGCSFLILKIYRLYKADRRNSNE
ncbi:hypothetical protein [Denitrobaculum tricleocarpae]|uniref:Uncharacterized protein n=1 Tax=Denitrobaculum tricleocarpae TaxID=2591009 RepID=A0A545TMI4_9PROT|nr:hypothetical protein [Denitrobaculum tricleocarpae]TQV78406.1 hypothetical protein FKG95_17730 [Denitrobaculum tricleocarpae]